MALFCRRLDIQHGQQPFVPLGNVACIARGDLANITGGDGAQCRRPGAEINNMRHGFGVTGMGGDANFAFSVVFILLL